MSERLPNNVSLFSTKLGIYQAFRQEHEWSSREPSIIYFILSSEKNSTGSKLGKIYELYSFHYMSVFLGCKATIARKVMHKPKQDGGGDLLPEARCLSFSLAGLASHEFCTKSLREFVVKVLEDEVESRLVPILDNAAANGAVLDLQEVLRRFAFDTICKVSLGMDPLCLDLSSPAPPLSAAFDAASEISAMRGTAPVAAVWKLKRLLNMGSEKDLKDAVKLVRGCVDEMIKSKREEMDHKNGGSSDLLSRFLQAGLDHEMVRDMTISFLMAGRDTTSAALTWLFWLLTCHRGIEEQVVEEITSIQNGGVERFCFDQLKEMSFTKACLCESMRLYPPVVWDSKHAAKDDVLPDGTPVQRGNRVTYFPYGMGRMEELWGKDRFEFRPDRWLDEYGAVKRVSPYKFPVFQAGPRVCLGKEMAFIQMKYVVASVLSRFEFVPVRSEPPVFVPLLTAHMKGGFNVRVRRRGGG